MIVGPAVSGKSTPAGPNKTYPLSQANITLLLITDMWKHHTFSLAVMYSDDFSAIISH